jgi:hypothetical protein
VCFILVPQKGDDLQVNAWNWRPTLETLYRENLINLENYERMGANGSGGHVDAERASLIADAIQRKLEAIKPGERVLADGSVTDRPKKEVTFKPQMDSQEVDVNDLYSTSYEWLARFRDFCRRSGGFAVS